ncbi:MAG: bifunctional NADP-dependent methylenetetrahydromethanopterin dehydrogenase/methylenetetrahydrofolate dehydrogenase [Planctomycetes bacterium]|nr:bifunctional NADP-dependent methylenetetrahydromethanopterin dehydrogenase/methylenetetrahydrofolate dehydrogenase [Planctomycetota bacterium]
MDKRTVLLQLDSDPQPSAFDRVVAVDAGADEVFSYGGVTPEQVQALVHGCIFTRGPKDLKRTAIFIGGSDVAAGEKLMHQAVKAMLPAFGLRVSVLLDANGANTTAAAAVRAAGRHLALKDCPALVLGGTGPVGQRVARLLAREGAEVRVGSRQQSRAAAVCKELAGKVSGARLTPLATGSPPELNAAVEGRILVIAAGAASAVLLPKSARQACRTLQVVIDLNAVPPLGIEGIEVTDKGGQRDSVLAYGAIGVGETKMKAHKAAIARLFESNDQVLDAEEVYQIALGLP